MKEHCYPLLGERLWEATLENGLRLRIVPKTGFARKYAFLAVDFGSVDTRFTHKGREYRMPEGIAHFLEHKAFDLPEEDTMALFAAQGANPNAFTSHDMTAYYFSCTEQFEENLRLMMRMVLTPCYTEQSVEKERGIIIQEIRMYDDSPESRVEEDLFALLFEGHPVSRPIAGTVEAVQSITAHQLELCHEAFYHPANMVLCVVGDVEPQAVAAIAGAYGQPGEIPQRHYGPSPALPGNCWHNRSMEASMPTFSQGFRCPDVGPGQAQLHRELAGELAAEILVGESSPLYQKLYEEGLIDGDFSVGYESIRDVSLFSLGGDSRDPEGVCQAVMEEGARLAGQGLDVRLFERLKKSALGRRLRALDSFESICYRICAYCFEGVEYFDFPAAFEALTPVQVQELLAQSIQPERAAVARICPKEEEPE